jgi:hypothetical protein
LPFKFNLQHSNKADGSPMIAHGSRVKIHMEIPGGDPVVGGPYKFQMQQFTHSARERLVSTLEPLKCDILVVFSQSLGFQILQLVPLRRGPHPGVDQDGGAGPRGDPLQRWGLYTLNPLHP